MSANRGKCTVTRALAKSMRKCETISQAIIARIHFHETFQHSKQMPNNAPWILACNNIGNRFLPSAFARIIAGEVRQKSAK